MLLALVVVTVPFLFDKEPPPPTVTIPLRIPSQNSVDVASIQVPGSSAAVTSAVVPSSEDKAAKPAAPTDAGTAKPASSKQNPPAQASKKDEKTPQKADKGQQKPEKSEAKNRMLRKISRRLSLKKLQNLQLQRRAVIMFRLQLFLMKHEPKSCLRRFKGQEFRDMLSRLLLRTVKFGVFELVTSRPAKLLRMQELVLVC